MNCKALEAKRFYADCRKESSILLVWDSESRCSAIPFLHALMLHHRSSVKLKTLHFRSGNR